MNRRLYRCRHDRRIAGVAAGVAEYFDLDPTLVRVVWFLSIFFGGFGLFLYIAMAIIVPLEPMTEEMAAAEAAAVSAGHRHVSRPGGGRWATFLGVALILLGGLALLDAAVPAWSNSWRYLWPAFLVGIGLLLVFVAMRREPTSE
jgi:phage shock protein C